MTAFFTVPLKALYGFKPYSTPMPPHLVEGLLKFEELARVLEGLMLSTGFQLFHGEETPWYEDDVLRLTGFNPTIALVKNLQWCDPCQVRLVLTHLPNSGLVVATHHDPALPEVQRRLMKLALCEPAYIRVCWLRGTERYIGSYPLTCDCAPEIVFEHVNDSKKTSV